MEGGNGGVDWSSEEMGDTFSHSEDDAGIVGEGEIDNGGVHEHLGIPVDVEPIADCSGLSRLEWVNLEVVLCNESGMPVAEGVCRNTHPHDCVDQNPLGDEDVGVVILESLVHSEVHPTQRFLLRRWPIRNVTMELACVIMSDAICKSKRNCKLACGPAKAYGSMIPCVFPALQVIVSVKNCLQKSPLEKWPRRIVVCTGAASCFHGRR